MPMPSPLSVDLRQRVVSAVSEGASCHPAAARFGVSVSTLMLGSDAAWDKLRPYGIKRIVERHPTEAAKIIVGEREIQVR
jgi:hypothetical protein